MVANSLTAVRKFVNGEDDPTIKELYQYALSSTAQASSQIEQIPIFTSKEQLKVFLAKSLLIDALRFNDLAKIKITQLAMNEAVLGDNPRISLVLDSITQKLQSPTELQIITAVVAQFQSDNLILELLEKGILKITLSL